MQIIFNNKVVSPGFGKGGIVVSQIGIRMYVTIPEIGVQVMFTGLIFSVEVPFSKFANNTEGQCGEPPSPSPARPRGRQPHPWSLNVAECPLGGRSLPVSPWEGPGARQGCSCLER